MSAKLNQHRTSLSLDDLDFFIQVGTVAPPLDRIKEIRAAALKVKKHYGEVFIDWLPDGTFEVRNKKFVPPVPKPKTKPAKK
jgi:hypothetical protein